MDGLGTALRDAAASARPSVGEPPALLWQQGRRRVRRRRLAGAAGLGAALVAFVLLAGTQPWSLPQREAVPIAPAGELRLPDEFFDPSPWLAGTQSEGEIGPLVAVMGAQRRSGLSGAEDGLVGVAGTTGEYRFLDLPFYDPGAERGAGEVALSTDGRRLAYWRADSSPLKSGSLAVYDTVTGDEVLWTPRAERGFGWIGGELRWSKGWLWFDYEEFIEEPTAKGSAAEQHGPFVWAPSPDSEPVERHRLAPLHDAAPDGADLVVRDGETIRWLGPDGSSRTANVRTGIEGRGLTGAVFVSPEGRLAALVDTDGQDYCCKDSYPLAAAEPARAGVALFEMTGDGAPEVLGWRDPGRVVVRAGDAFRSARLDGRDGPPQPLDLRVIPAPGAYGPGLIVAAEAWRAPLYDAREPDWPPDPRVIVLIAAAAVGISIAQLTWWRRRVR